MSFTDLGAGCGASSGVRADGGAGGDGGAEFSAGAGPEDGTIDGTGAGTRELGAGVGTSEAEGAGVCEEGAGTAGCKKKTQKQQQLLPSSKDLATTIAENSKRTMRTSRSIAKKILGL